MDQASGFRSSLYSNSVNTEWVLTTYSEDNNMTGILVAVLVRLDELGGHFAQTSVLMPGKIKKLEPGRLFIPMRRINSIQYITEEDGIDIITKHANNGGRR